MLLRPDQYAGTPVRDLLLAAALGHVGLDHRFLHAILDRFDEAAPELVRFGLEDRDDPVPLDADLIDLFRYRPRAEALPLLIEFVRRYPLEVPDELVEACCRLGEVAIGPLLDLCAELGPERDPEVAFVLAALGVPDPRIQKLLQDRLAADRDEGAFLLEVYGEPAGTLEPYDIWSDYPEQCGPRFDLMPRERLVELAGTDPDPEVRGHCWARLGGSEEAEAVRSAMLDRLRDPEVPLAERSGALVGLSLDAENAVLRRYILEFYDLPAARARALEAMWRSMDPGFAPYFARHLEDPDLEIRREAVMGVGYLRMHAEAGKLERYFFDEELRQDALYSYALAAPGKVSALHVRQVLVKIDKLADGLSPEETELVETALDDLLELHGLAPVFSQDEDETPAPQPAEKPGRNDPCPCGSGKKFKKCCGQ